MSRGRDLRTCVCLMLALMVMATSCSTSADISVVTLEAPTLPEQPPPTDPPPTATSPPDAEPVEIPEGPTEIPIVPTASRTEGMLVFAGPDGLSRLDADGSVTSLIGGASAEVTLLADGLVLGVDIETIWFWAADGSSTSAACAGCMGAAVMGDVIVAIGPDGALRRFALDLAPIDTIDTVLTPELDPNTPNDSVDVVGVAATGELIVVAHTGEYLPSAYGGPFAFWALNSDGTGRFIAGVEANVGAQVLTFSPDRGSVLYNHGFRAGFCAQFEAVGVVDIVSGATTMLPPIWEIPSGFPPDEQQFVSNIFQTDDGIYAIASIDQGYNGSFECEFSWPSALWRFADAAWRIVDSGPVAQVYPLDADKKAYVIIEGDNYVGDLYFENSGTATLVSRDARIVTALSAQRDVNLEPPPRLSTEAQATFDELLVAAESGSIQDLADAAGDEFSFSFGGDTDPVAVWEGSGETFGTDVPAIVATLLTRAPLAIDDSGEVRVFVWAEPLDVGWRVGIDETGVVRWIIAGD